MTILSGMSSAEQMDDNLGTFKNFYAGLVSRSGKASDCIACGQCESVCPQHLPIIELMKEAAGILD